MATSHQDGLDPTGAQTPEAFMQLLRQACAASGLSYVEIAELARRRGYDLDPAALAQVMEQSALPSWQTVTGVLTACGMGGMQIDRWMRVYHDLAAPAAPVAPVAPVIAVQEPVDVAPVSVPPLVLTTPSARPARFTPRHFAVGGGVLAALIVVPLLLVFGVFNGEPDTVAVVATSSAPRTTAAAPPAPSPSDVPVVQPSPTDVPAPTTPAPVTTTARPPVRTTAPPPPPPPPPSSPADPGVLRSGVLELTGNQGFNFDTGQSDGGNDISRVNSDTLAGANGGRLEPMSGMPSKQACQAEQGWEFVVGNLQAGQWLCVRTTDGRYGRLNITAVGGTLKLSYTVWT